MNEPRVIKFDRDKYGVGSVLMDVSRDLTYTKTRHFDGTDRWLRTGVNSWVADEHVAQLCAKGNMIELRVVAPTNPLLSKIYVTEFTGAEVIALRIALEHYYDEVRRQENDETDDWVKLVENIGITGPAYGPGQFFDLPETYKA